MNFDFLKGLAGLEYIYANCSNAERLAVGMPVQSMFTSRKSAELLAKFLYMTAHNQQMERMTFADILSDTTFQEYIANHHVINAFHHIRKSGNRAVHGNNEETSEEAIAVLRDLHYVAGESACMLGLLQNYPKFDDSISEDPDAKFIEEENIEAKVHEMVIAYMAEHSAQMERDNYYAIRVDRLSTEFEDYCVPFTILPGIEDICETIEFTHKPKLQSTIKKIQDHFGLMGLQAIRKLRGELKYDLPLEYTCELTIYGEDGYTTTDLVDFIRGIIYDLPKSEGFMIKSIYYGPSLKPWTNRDVREVFNETTVDDMGEDECFTYTLYRYVYNCGGGGCSKFVDGNWVDLSEQFSTEILDKDFGYDWWSDQIELNVEFDYDKHPEILEALHDTVRKYVPKEEQEECINCWEDGYREILIASVVWTPRKLRVIQNFLDQVNRILAPILSECKGSVMGQWYMQHVPFAIARCEWDKNGFQIMGTELYSKPICSQ